MSCATVGVSCKRSPKFAPVGDQEESDGRDDEAAGYDVIGIAKIGHEQRQAAARSTATEAAIRFRLFGASAAPTSACFTRNSQSSKNARKSLKTNDRVPFYPERRATHDHAEFTASAIANGGGWALRASA